MDSPKYSKTDPAVLLLNEIEILLAQTRLMELCLKQAQAAADDQMARMQEQYQGELTALRSALAAMEQTLAARESERSAKSGLQERVRSLESQLDEERRVNENRGAELRSSKADAQFLRDRIGQLEAAREQAQAAAAQAGSARQALDAELAAVRHELEANQASFAIYQTEARELQEGWQAQIDELHEQLRLKENHSQNVTRDLEQASQEVAVLGDRLWALQAGREESEQRAARELEQARTRFDAELAELRSRLEERDQALRENQSALIGIERELKSAISTIGNQLQQQRQLVEFRDQELRDAHSRSVALEQRVAELDAANRSVAANADELNRLCHSRESEIAALQQQIAAKERVLTERQEAVTAVERALHDKIQSLQQDLARHRGEIEERDGKIGSARVEAEALRQRMTELESALASAERARESTETKRREMDIELSGLRIALKQKESAAAQQQSDLRSTIEQWSAETAQHRAEAAALRQRITELESAAAAASQSQEIVETERRELQAEVAGLRATLQEKESASAQQQSALDSTVEQWRSAVDRERGQTAALRQRIVELETAAASAELRAQEVTESSRRELEDEIGRLRAALEQKESAAAQQQSESRSNLERLNVEIDSKRSEAEALRQRIAELQSAAATASQAQEIVETRRRELENEVTQLRVTLEQKEYINAHQQNDFNSALDQLNAELDQQRQEAGTLRQRIAELESATQAAGQTQALAETIRRELENEVTRLRADLEQKETASAQQQSDFQSILEPLKAEIEQQRAEADTLRQRIAEFESAATTAGRTQEIVETTRRELESEIAGLRDALEQKDSISAQQQSDFKSALERLNTEIDRQRAAAERRRQMAEHANAELESLRAALAAVEAQKTQSELARRQLEENWQQAGSSCRELEARLEAKDHEIRDILSKADEAKESALSQQQEKFKALEEQLNGEIGRVREHLDHQQKEFEQARDELTGLRAAFAAREQENAQTERSRRELERNWQQATALRNELEERSQKKDEELRAAQSSIHELQMRLDAGIHEWQLHVAEKQLLVESRGAEIATLKADLTRLSEQLAQRESSENQTKADFRRLTESTRAAHQADLTALEEGHRAKQKSWENELAQERRTLADLSQRISELEGQYRDAETRLKDRENELAAAAETATWRARFEELETLRQTERAGKEEADQVRSDLDTELGALRHELQQKAWASAQQQAALENLALAHKNQIQKLEAKLDEQQRGIKGRDLELESARSQAQSLEQRIEELQSELKQTELTARDRTHQLTREFSTKIDDINKQLTQTAAEHGATQSNLEQALRNELDQQMREAREKNRILQDRNDELVRVKAEMDQLQERLNQLESSASQTETALTGNAERMRTEFQAQLALLQAELSQKDWALEEQRAYASGTVQQHREQIEALRQQLANTKAGAQENSTEFVLGDNSLTDEQRERQQKHREVMQAVISGADRSFPASQNRRWHSRFSWKRRWKS